MVKIALYDETDDDIQKVLLRDSDHKFGSIAQDLVKEYDMKDGSVNGYTIQGRLEKDNSSGKKGNWVTVYPGHGECSMEELGWILGIHHFSSYYDKLTLKMKRRRNNLRANVPRGGDRGSGIAGRRSIVPRHLAAPTCSKLVWQSRLQRASEFLFDYQGTDYERGYDCFVTRGQQKKIDGGVVWPEHTLRTYIKEREHRSFTRVREDWFFLRIQPDKGVTSIEAKFSLKVWKTENDQTILEEDYSANTEMRSGCGFGTKGTGQTYCFDRRLLTKVLRKQVKNRDRLDRAFGSLTYIGQKLETEVGIRVTIHEVKVTRN